jgi:glutamate dehydrogenase
MIDAEVVDRSAITLLHKMVDIVKYTLRTNLFLDDRYSLGLRLDPKLMHSEESDAPRELPYGVVFCHGRRFNGYHVRFRDIARGGMRLVTPASPEQLALEVRRSEERQRQADNANISG